MFAELEDEEVSRVVDACADVLAELGLGPKG